MEWKRNRRDIHLLFTAFKKFNDDHGFFLSSGIAFNLLIGLIPLSLLLLALVGTYLYSDRAVLSHISKHLEEGERTQGRKEKVAHQKNLDNHG